MKLILFLITVNVGEDCPVFDGLYEFCQLSAGGSVAAAVKLNKQVIFFIWIDILTFLLYKTVYKGVYDVTSAYIQVTDIKLCCFTLLRHYSQKSM